jgi:hypothetical protein
MDPPPVWLHYNAGQDVWTLQIHAQPGASRNEVIGEHGGRLKLKVAAPAVDNKANTCLIEYLSKLLGVARSQITIIRGESARHKTIVIHRAGAGLAKKLEQMITT